MFIEFCKAVLTIKAHRSFIFFPYAEPDVFLIVMNGNFQCFIVEKLPYFLAVIGAFHIDPFNFQRSFVLKFGL